MNEEEGSHLVGAISAVDTMVLQNIVYKYPEAVGQMWDYSGISYNVESQVFRLKPLSFLT